MAPEFRHSTRYPGTPGSRCVDLSEGLANQRVAGDHQAAETALLLEFSGRFQDRFVEITQPFYKSAAEVSLTNGIVEDRPGSRTGWMVQPPQMAARTDFHIQRAVPNHYFISSRTLRCCRCGNAPLCISFSDECCSRLPDASRVAKVRAACSCPKWREDSIVGRV